MRLISFISLIIIFSFSAIADIPKIINYQGLLRNATTGEPVADGFYPMEFRLYPDSVSTAWLWSEMHPAIMVTGGIYKVELGTITPLSPSLFTQSLWVDVIVGGVPLAPRYKLGSSPYAFTIGWGAMQTGFGSAGLKLTNTRMLGSSVELATDSKGISVVHSGSGGGENIYGVVADISGTTAPRARGALGMADLISVPPADYGVYGYSESGYAGFFDGNVKVNGQVIASSGRLGPQIYTVTFLDLVPMDTTFATIDLTNARLILRNVPSSDIYFYAPLHLPVGAKIDSVFTKIYDNDTSLNLTVEIIENTLEGAVPTNITLYSSSTTAGAAWQDLIWRPIISPTISEPTSSPTASRIYLVRVKYPAGIMPGTGFRSMKIFYR